MATDVQIGVHYDTPSQPPDNGDGLGLGGPVTRQVGLAPSQQVGIDPVPPQPVIQPGVPDMVVSRNSGPHVRGHFDASGVFFADHVADDHSVVYADGGVREGVSNQPPGLARIAAPLVPDPSQPLPPRPGFDAASSAPPAVQPMDRAAFRAMAEAMGFVVTEAAQAPATGVVQAAERVAADVMQADAGAVDDRDKSTGPQVFSLSALPTIKKHPIVPVDVSPPVVDVDVIASAQVKAAGKTVKAKAPKTKKTTKKGGR